MAVNFSVSDSSSRTSEYRIDPREIKVMPELNGRHVLPEIDTLIKDMLSKPDGRTCKGQTTPVIIRRDGTTPVLVAGHRRLRAVMEINKRKLGGGEPWLLRCSYMQLSEVEALSVAVTENRERCGVTPLDEAYCIKQFLRLGKDHDWIARNGGFFPGLDGDGPAAKKAIAWIKRREKLLGLTPEAEAALTAGKLKPTAAEHFASLEAEKQRSLLAQGEVTGASIRKAEGKTAKPGFGEVKAALRKIVETGKLPNGVKVDDGVVEYLESLVG